MTGGDQLPESNESAGVQLPVFGVSTVGIDPEGARPVPEAKEKKNRQSPRTAREFPSINPLGIPRVYRYYQFESTIRKRK